MMQNILSSIDLVNLVLAIATLIVAIGTRRLASIAEREYRAERMPIVQIHGTGHTFKYGRFSTRAMVKNITPRPIVIHEIWIGGGLVFPYSDRPLQAGEEYLLRYPLELDISNEDIIGARRSGFLRVGGFTIAIEVSVQGLLDTKERWEATGWPFLDEHANEVHVDWRTTHASSERQQSFCSKVKRCVEWWDERQEQWKREMNH